MCLCLGIHLLYTSKLRYDTAVTQPARASCTPAVISLANCLYPPCPSLPNNSTPANAPSVAVARRDGRGKCASPRSTGHKLPALCGGFALTPRTLVPYGPLAASREPLWTRCWGLGASRVGLKPLASINAGHAVDLPERTGYTRYEVEAAVPQAQPELGQVPSIAS